MASWKKLKRGGPVRFQDIFRGECVRTTSIPPETHDAERKRSYRKHCDFQQFCPHDGYDHSHVIKNFPFFDDEFLFGIPGKWAEVKEKCNQDPNAAGRTLLPQELVAAFHYPDVDYLHYIWAFDRLCTKWSNYMIKREYPERVSDLPIRLLSTKHNPMKLPTLDVRIFHVEIANAVIDTSLGMSSEIYALMSAKLYAEKFGVSKRGEELCYLNFFKSASKYINKYRARGFFKTIFSWGPKEIDSIIGWVAVVEDPPHQLILTSGFHEWFLNDDILRDQYEEKIFRRTRAKSKAPELINQQCLGTVNLKRSTMLLHYEIISHKDPESMDDLISFTAALIKRFAVTAKKCLITKQVKKATRPLTEVLSDPSAKYLRSIFDYILNTYRAVHFLPTGRRRLRMRCGCPVNLIKQFQLMLRLSMGTVYSWETDLNVTFSRMKWIKYLVLEEKWHPHMHMCSNLRCPSRHPYVTLNPRRMPRNIRFKACQKCVEQKLRVRHFYCSRECQIQEWEWSHRAFHYLVEQTVAI